ncbi:MAG: DUF819 domain-containing protein [Rhodothermales bacterium]
MPDDAATALITEPTALFAFLAALLGLIFYLSTLPALKKFFDYMPPVIWAYFLPMFATTFGITPDSSAVYGWMARYLLPLSLFLLMITVDLPAIMRLGKIALLMMVAGTVGIVLGGPLAYGLFSALGLLPEDAWQGLAALSGSWIGGTANMVAVQQHVEASLGPAASIDLGPIIVVDTVVGYGWMGILIFLSAMQKPFDKWVGADTSFVNDLNQRLLELDTTRRPVKIADLAIFIGLGLAATVVARVAAGWIPAIRLSPDAPSLISTTTWTILIVVTVGLILSFTPMRKLEQPGASRLGYLALYLLLTSIGAQANLAAVLDAPIFLATGAVWIAIHVAILFLVAWLLKAPMFFVATGSMANIGGAASAPIVAEVYLPAMAPVGLLMAVAGYILGIYAALGCAEIFRWISTM